MKPTPNLKGRKFGKLYVLRDADRWLCRCDCGRLCTAGGQDLLNQRKVCCSECKQNGNYPHKTKAQVSDSIKQGMEDAKVDKVCYICGTHYKGLPKSVICSDPECAATHMRNLQATYRQLQRELNSKEA